MIVVSGSARTGTSMMMQTLKELGVPMVAPAFVEGHSAIIKYNPKGFYELELEDLMKIKTEHYGKALKVFGAALSLFDISLISKMIVMVRNKEEAVKSSAKVYKALNESVDPSFAYDMNYEIINMICKEISTIFINFEDMKSNPEKEIKKVVEFLKLNSREEKLNNAVKNIEVWH